MASTVRLSISNSGTFPMMEGHMFGKSTQDSAAPPFFYLMMAAAYFRQATHTRHRHLRHRDSGREHPTNAHQHLTNAHRVVPPHGSPGRWPAIVSHLTPKSASLGSILRRSAAIRFHKDRRIQMRKINFLTVAAALILAGVGTWAASTTHASVAAPSQIDPLQMMMSAPKNLPTQQEVDKRLEQMNLSGCDSACARAVQDYFTNS
jgi:hypothetical protein